MLGIVSFLWSGCATKKSGVFLAPTGASRTEDSGVPFGTVILVTDSSSAQISFQKAKGQRDNAADRAGNAASRVLAVHTGQPWLDVAVAAGTLTLAPFAAARAALAGRQSVSPGELEAAENSLSAAMQTVAAQSRFHQCLLQAADARRPGQLLSIEQWEKHHSNRERIAGILEARVEELRLERANGSDTSYALHIKTHTRLMRPDGTVLFEQPGEYRSETGLFLDWTSHDVLSSVANAGYRALAAHLVEEALARNDSPLLVGVGFGKTPGSTPRPEPNWTTARAPTRFEAQSLQRVSFPIADLSGTLGIYSTATVASVQWQRPQTRSEANAEAVRDVEWMLDGLNKHPNVAVAVTASAVALPISLWKQTVATTRGLGSGALRKAEASLNQAASRTQPHQELAFELAQCLMPQTSQRVMLVKKSLPPGAEQDPDLLRCLSHGTLTWLPEDQTVNRYLTGQGADTALEIHVLSARLDGPAGINPRLALCVDAQATLLRPRDGQLFYSCPLRYRSEARTFTAWATHDARPFRQELQRCYRELSSALVDQLLSRGMLPKNTRPQATFVNAAPASRPTAGD